MTRKERRRPTRQRTTTKAARLERKSANEFLAGKVVSLGNLLGGPVLDAAGRRVGRLNDVVARWDKDAAHPIVTSLIVKTGRALTRVAVSDVRIEQHRIHLQTPRLVVSIPERQPDEIALARDVLDRQLVDVSGIQVVRAADVYLSHLDATWHLGGVDVSQRAFWRRTLPRRRTSPRPAHLIDWADLQTFVPRFFDYANDSPESPAAAAGSAGGSVRLGAPAANLHTLNARDVAALLRSLERTNRAQLSTNVGATTLAEALRTFNVLERDMILSELVPHQQGEIRALLEGESP
ncbi:MAG: PRC-barrel domain-containing protein [Acidimicrobiales bacterium]